MAFYILIRINRAIGADGKQNFQNEEFYKIIAKYKFVLAMENAVCDDYVYVYLKCIF